MTPGPARLVEWLPRGNTERTVSLVVALALGLPIPAGAQESGDAANVTGEASPAARPETIIRAGEALSTFRLENVESARPDLTYTALPVRGCGAAEAGAIVVCARKGTQMLNQTMRLRPLVIPPSPPSLTQQIGRILEMFPIFGKPRMARSANDPINIVKPHCKQLIIGSERCL